MATLFLITIYMNKHKNQFIYHPRQDMRGGQRAAPRRSGSVAPDLFSGMLK
jgi:hypothetical protein